MPITFPPILRGNPFDRYKWQRGAKPSMFQQIQPNMFSPGNPFVTVKTTFPVTTNQLAPNSIVNNPRQKRRAIISNRLAPLYVVNPVNFPYTNNVIYNKVQGQVTATLTGVSRDNTGATLGDCRIMIFREATNELIMETRSDGSGNWSVTLPCSPAGIFLRETKDEPATLAGTSVGPIVLTITGG